MHVFDNPLRGAGLPPGAAQTDTPVSVDADAVRALLSRCPKAKETPLVPLPDLASHLRVGALWAKDERGRMGLGSFKALGAAYVIAQDAVARGGDGDDLGAALKGTTYVTASAGNHGMSVAAGARVFGADAVVYLAKTVSEAFAKRLRDKGARVVREGETYEASMAAAARAAADNDWVLLSDSSWPGYTEIPARLMEGYLAMAAEAADALERQGEQPSHVFLQAGVGGMAAAVAAYLRKRWGEAPLIVVVEPEAAPALMESVRAGRAVRAEGPISCMGRLDCKEPSHIALAALARDADRFVTVSEGEAQAALPVLAVAGLATTASGAAGLAALLAAKDRTALSLTPESRVLAFVTEGPEGGAP